MSDANATMGTTVALELREPPEKESDPIFKKSEISKEKMSQLSALAFDPRNSMPRPKRNALLHK